MRENEESKIREKEGGRVLGRRESGTGREVKMERAREKENHKKVYLISYE